MLGSAQILRKVLMNRMFDFSDMHLVHGLCPALFTKGTAAKTVIGEIILQCQCSALSVELLGQLGAGHYVGQ